MKSINPELLKRFFEGKCTPEEVHQILIWINSKEGINELVEDFQKFEAKEEVPAEKKKETLAKIYEKIKEEEGFTPNKTDSVIESGNRDFFNVFKKQRWLIGVAVSFFLAILVSGVWLYSNRNSEKEEQLFISGNPENITRETKAGEKLKLKLSDGSILHVNSNSKIEFPKKFTGSTREVFLEGQAFFEVQRDESKPFIVHTKGLLTKVLGTSFSIKEEAGGQMSQVAVLTGKVQVEKPSKLTNDENNSLILEPMSAANFYSENNLLEKVKIDYDEVFAWKDNVIVFQNVDFKEVIKRLENWYGVQFKIKKPVNGVSDYSGRFENQTLEEVLLGISFTYDFEFEIQDSTVLIY